MDFNFKICVLFIVLVLTVDATNKKKKCQQCIPVQDCKSLEGLSKEQQERWFEEASCQTAQQEEDEEISFLYGFAPFAKGDYICCPDSTANKNEQRTHENAREQNYQNQPSGSNRPSNWNNDKSNPESGTSDFGNKFGNDRRPESQWKPNNNDRYNADMGNLNRPATGNFRNQMPINQQNGNNFRNDRRPNDHWNNGGLTFGSSNGQENNNFGNRRPNTHANLNQGFQNPNTGNINSGQSNNRRPNNVNPPNRRPNQSLQTENPYFMARTTTRKPNNSDRNRRINPALTNIAEQCQSLTSVPPGIDSGCCGRDASIEQDRIIATPQRPKTFAPAQTNQFPRSHNSFQPASSSNWPSFFPSSFNFFSSSDDTESRMKRAVRNQTDAVNITLDNRIAGGKATAIGQFPWLVLLKSIFDYGTELQAFNCGGSLISATYVLTAGHCVYDSEATLSDVEITLAEYDKRTFPNDCANDEEGRRCIKNVRFNAADVIRHPDYDDTRLQNDIALIRLRTRAPYTEFIRPICLPPIDIDNPEFSNLPLHVSGWGRNGIYNSNVKQSTVVNLVPQRDCKRSYSFLTRRHVCAAGYSGEDTCKGDSGGPLMLFYEGKYFVSGVVSGKRADSPCGTSVPSLYTNVYHYLDWIRSNIRN